MSDPLIEWLFKLLIFLTKSHFFNPWFWIRQKQLYYVDIKWNIYDEYCLSPFLVKQGFVELLSRMTKIRYLPTLIHMKLFFLIYRNKAGVLVILLLTECIHIFVCVYFLHCDSMKRRHHEALSCTLNILTVKLARIWRNSPVSFRCSKLSRVCKIK